jgi:hypothetical protein
MGDPYYDRGTETNMIDRILVFVERCEVEMIIIDEIQHLIDSESKKVMVSYEVKIFKIDTTKFFFNNIRKDLQYL